MRIILGILFILCGITSFFFIRTIRELYYIGMLFILLGAISLIVAIEERDQKKKRKRKW